MLPSPAGQARPEEDPALQLWREAAAVRCRAQALALVGARWAPRAHLVEQQAVCVLVRLSAQDALVAVRCQRVA